MSSDGGPSRTGALSGPCMNLPDYCRLSTAIVCAALMLVGVISCCTAIWWHSWSLLVAVCKPVMLQSMNIVGAPLVFTSRVWPVLQERSAIQGLHDSVFSSRTGELSTLDLAPDFQDTLWAACMVNSRCFSDLVSQGSGLAPGIAHTTACRSTPSWMTACHVFFEL